MLDNINTQARYKQILLLGCDVNQDTIGQPNATKEDRCQRSDAIVVLFVDEVGKSIKIIDLMRDVLVPIPDRGIKKLNEVVVFGGPKLAMQVINDNFGLDIQSYVQITINGLIEIVDLFGGVDVYLSDAEVNYINEWMPDVKIVTLRDDNVPLITSKGWNHLNGMQTLAHIRNRTIGSYIGRENRVNNVLKSMAQFAKNEMSFFQCLRFALQARKYIKNNLSFVDVIKLLRLILHLNPKTIETYHAPEEGTYRIADKISGSMDVDFEKASWLLQKFLTEKPIVALTFDDGPSGKNTGAILKLLSKYNVPATFCVVGNRIGIDSKIVRQMKMQGCEIVNHSWAHEDFTNISEDKITESLMKTEDEISRVCGVHTAFVRAPYVKKDYKLSSVLKRLGKAQLAWNVDPRDWESRDADTITSRVLEGAKDGSVVILHDIYPATHEAATRFIPELIERGFELVTVSELARRQNLSIIPGERYFAHE